MNVKSWHRETSRVLPSDGSPRVVTDYTALFIIRFVEQRLRQPDLRRQSL